MVFKLGSSLLHFSLLPRNSCWVMGVLVSACSEEDDEYSDDDDVSWKVRRAAAKCLGVILGSRPEMLPTFYQEVSPAIIKRFKGKVKYAYMCLFEWSEKFSTQLK